jgi:spermidine/putrescine transport system permease protein
MTSTPANRLRAFFLTPVATVMLATLGVPLAIVTAYSFLSRGPYGGVEMPWTEENYTRLFDPLYAGIFLRSAWVALLATAGCLVLAFPLALFIARSGARKNLYLALVILPFWTSFLIRLYAWMFLLRDTGLINTAFISLGLIHAPLPLLYNEGAVLLGLIYGYLPFAVLPLYATLERQDPVLLDAAADLGATPWRALFRVTIPLSMPGILAASILVFVPCIGTYIVSDLLGGSKTVLIGNLVQNQFTSSRDWPFGAAASIVLIVAAIAMLHLMRRSREELL